jgi:glycerol-3-phosphate acyltransferase PlsY
MREIEKIKETFGMFRMIVVMNYMIYHHRYQILINYVRCLVEIYFLLNNFVIYSNNENIHQILIYLEH